MSTAPAKFETGDKSFSSFTEKAHNEKVNLMCPTFMDDEFTPSTHSHTPVSGKSNYKKYEISSPDSLECSETISPYEN